MAGGLPPDGHAASTRRAIVTRTPIKRDRMQVIDQVSISIIVMKPGRLQSFCKFVVADRAAAVLVGNAQAGIGGAISDLFLSAWARLPTIRASLAGPRHTKTRY
jgi:hypothetical protein